MLCLFSKKKYDKIRNDISLSATILFLSSVFSITNKISKRLKPSITTP